MHNEIVTQPLSITLMMKDTLAAELVNGDPAEMWPGLTISSTPLDEPYFSMYLVQVKGRSRRGEVYSYDSIKITEWRLRPPLVSIGLVPADALLDTLTPQQIRIVSNWLMRRSASAWLRASDEVREALGKPEPFLSVAEASRRAGIPVTTLDSAVRSTPQRVPAAQDNRGFFRVRMSALNRARDNGRLRSGIFKRRSTRAK